jgi:hypothetical protein
MGDIGTVRQRYDVLPMPSVGVHNADEWTAARPPEDTVPAPEPMPVPQPGPTPEPIPGPGTPPPSPAPDPGPTPQPEPTGPTTTNHTALR